MSSTSGHTNTNRFGQKKTFSPDHFDIHVSLDYKKPIFLNKKLWKSCNSNLIKFILTQGSISRVKVLITIKDTKGRQ